MVKLLATVLVVLSVASLAHAWGDEGHRATAGVATALLNNRAKAQVKTLLNADLSQFATWADFAKYTNRYRWSYELHFINTASWACDFVQEKDCANNRCLTGAIANFTKQEMDVESALKLLATPVSLKDLQRGALGKDLPWEPEKVVAVKFLDHFFGDLHQPLHVGFSADKGGNTISGHYMGDKDNLHQVWDGALIKTRLRDFSSNLNQWTDSLVKRVTAGDFKAKVAEWTSCKKQKEVTPGVAGCPTEWAAETAALACKFCYTDQKGSKVQNGFSFDQDYYKFALPVLEEQIAKGGVRLAMLLNNIWPDNSSNQIDAPTVADLPISVHLDANSDAMDQIVSAVAGTSAVSVPVVE
eukprot:GILI01005052.1.p2 GENE.GILI01005052.1~~GILI01005052.1.p2  ORF type:complete len:356 (-),score=128.01 GILI01005052.1:64-1131(-)